MYLSYAILIILDLPLPRSECGVMWYKDMERLEPSV